MTESAPTIRRLSGVGKARESSSPSIALALACGATFLAVLDTTVVNIAFPAIHQSFPGTPLADLTWVVTSYTVMLAALLAAAGRYADVLGRRRVFLWAISVFTAASLLSACAPSMKMLLVARAIQGASAAAVVPSGLAILLAETPAERRTSAVGSWSAAGALASAVGPVLSGVLSSVSNWRLIFAINVPVGVAMVGGAVYGLAADRTSGRGSERLPDPLGTALFTAGMAALVVGVTQSGDRGWTSPAVTLPVMSGLVLVSAGLLRSLRHAAPALNLRLFNTPTFAIANAATLVFSAAMYAMLLCSPLFLTIVWHYSVLQAGLAVSPGAILSIAAALYIGKRATAVVQRTVAVLGCLGLAVNCFAMYAILPHHHGFLVIWLPMSLLGGISAGASLTALAAASTGATPAGQFAAGTGILMTSRQAGGSFGVAIMGILVAHIASGHPDGLYHVFLFCSIAALVAAAIGLALNAGRVQQKSLN